MYLKKMIFFFNLKLSCKTNGLLYLIGNTTFREVKHVLKSANILADTKKKFLRQLTFEAEPAEFGKALSDYNLET